MPCFLLCHVLSICLSKSPLRYVRLGPCTVRRLSIQILHENQSHAMTLTTHSEQKMISISLLSICLYVRPGPCTVHSAHASWQPIPNYHARPLWREHRKYGINTRTNGWHWMHYTGVKHCIYGKINTCVILPLLLVPRAAQIWTCVKFSSALMPPITLFVLHSENLIWLIVIKWL